MKPPLHIPIRIAGLGHYLPGRIVPSEDLEPLVGVPTGWIAKHTGVIQRQYASGETSAYMAAMAARMALENAQARIEDIDLIIGASSVPQQAIPCTATFVQRELGAPDGGSTCFDINATCLSFMFAVVNAGHLLASGAYKKALVFSSEIPSLALNHQEAESAALFGDAAAAAVLEVSQGSSIAGYAFKTYSSGAEATRLLGGGTLHAPNTTHDTPAINLFSMNGPTIFKHASRTMPRFVQGILQQVGWDTSSVDLVVPHQASGPAVQLMTRQLGFGPDQLMFNLPTRGNCVAASIPLALSEAYAQNRLRRGQKVLMLGTAAGLTLGALALEF
jgi:3-oxoacyl-[acyl-carrier-protein] synthase III